MSQQIPSFDYLRALPEIEGALVDALRRVLRSGRLILGPETEAFEAEFAAFAEAKHCVGVTSGTTALHLALLALEVGPGDEVVTVANTCAPTIAAIRLTGATPVFVDVRDDTLLMDTEQLESVLSERTRCILPVHLWGHAADMSRVTEIATRHRVVVVEDCAQAHGATWRGKKVGTFGAAGCFSFYPTKNIGAYGDAGAVVTNDAGLVDRLRRLRMYGYEGTPVAREEGLNGRMSETQAAFLRLKLERYPEALAHRLELADLYDERIRHPDFRAVTSHPDEGATYHQYVIRCRVRNELRRWLEEHSVGSGIHYPVPVHRMPAYERFSPSQGLPVTESSCEQVLSLPLFDTLSRTEAEVVADIVNRFPG